MTGETTRMSKKHRDHNTAVGIKACYHLLRAAVLSRQQTRAGLSQNDILRLVGEHVEDLEATVRLLLNVKFGECRCSSSGGSTVHDVVTLQDYRHKFSLLYPATPRSRCRLSQRSESTVQTTSSSSCSEPADCSDRRPDDPATRAAPLPKDGVTCDAGNELLAAGARAADIAAAVSEGEHCTALSSGDPMLGRCQSAVLSAAADEQLQELLSFQPQQQHVASSLSSILSFDTGPSIFNGETLSVFAGETCYGPPDVHQTAAGGNGMLTYFP